MKGGKKGKNGKLEGRSKRPGKGVGKIAVRNVFNQVLKLEAIFFAHDNQKLRLVAKPVELPHLFNGSELHPARKELINDNPDFQLILFIHKFN